MGGGGHFSSKQTKPSGCDTPRHRDRFLLSSWPDNPVLGPAEGIRKERRKGGKANVGKGGKKTHPAEKLAGGSAGARRLRSAPAYSSRTLLTAGAGMSEIYCPRKKNPFCSL